MQNTTGGVQSILDSTAAYLASLPTGAAYRDALAIVAQRVDALSSFVGRIAEAIKIPEPTRARLDAVPFLARIAAESRLAYPGVPLSVSLPPCPFYVDMDLLQMRRVLENIIKNAVEAAAPQQGEVAIALIDEQGGQFVVANSGQGIPPEATSLLFAPFYTTKAHGQGLGLMLCREILNRHGFRFRLATEEDGITRFRIWLADRG